jgi:hypothetical protein
MERIIFRSYMPEYFHTHAWIIFTFWSTSSHLPWGTAALTLGLHTNHARFVTNSNGISYDPYFTAAGRFADTCTLLGSISCSSYTGRFSGKLLAYMPGSQTTLWKFELILHWNSSVKISHICRQVYARRASCLVRPRHYTSIPIAIWMEYLWDFVFEFSLHLAYSYNYVVQTHYALILTLGPWCTNSQDVPLTS